VLVVDDEPAIVTLPCDFLDAEGFDVLTAQDGAAALAVLARGPVDCVVLVRPRALCHGRRTCRARPACPGWRYPYPRNVLPDRGSWHLLNRRNYLAQGGTLVVEVIPAARTQVPIPAIGAHVRVTGAYVTDLEHGWREIHPAWQIVPAP
jgi:hypothetical protein